MCARCGQRFPTIGGILCLFGDPQRRIDEWRSELADFTQNHETTRNNILAQLAQGSLPRSTRQRLQTLHEMLAIHGERLLSIMRRAGLTPRARVEPSLSSVPGEGTLTAYYHQIHRDWSWPADQNFEIALARYAIARVLGERSLGRTLVLGAGACRLVRDIHLDHAAEITVAFDMNPLPFIVAKRLLFEADTELSLFEFPISPRTSKHVAVDRPLFDDRPRPDGLHLVFADGLDPPVAPETFDTVVTPWFIDQIPADLATLLPVLHRVLAPGGCWLNHGPLIYHPSRTKLAHRYRIDELLELAADHGFEITEHRHERMPYMQSPAGTQGRTEFIATFCATKLRQQSRAVPDEKAWQLDPNHPVPRFAGVESFCAPHPLFAAVAQRIDGQRSAADIAAELIEHHGLPPDAAVQGVHACVLEIARRLGAPDSGDEP
jgi:SAM-dependent methyltransferase